MIPAGSVAGGVLATAFDLHTAILVGAIGGTLCFLPVLFSPVRSLRAIEGREGEPARGSLVGAPSPSIEPGPEPTFGELD
jgi:hypothetical protein